MKNKKSSLRLNLIDFERATKVNLNSTGHGLWKSDDSRQNP